MCPRHPHIVSALSSGDNKECPKAMHLREQQWDSSYLSEFLFFSFSIEKAESLVVYPLPILPFLIKRNKILLRLTMYQIKEYSSYCKYKWLLKCQWKSFEASGKAALLFLFLLSRTWMWQMVFQQPSCYHEAILGVGIKSRKIEGGWIPDDHEASLLSRDSQPLDFMLRDRKRNF